jgi:hypothetical protein
MRLKAFVLTRMNCFDKCLWQDKLGQYSLDDVARENFRLMCPCSLKDCLLLIPPVLYGLCGSFMRCCLRRICDPLPFGSQYIGQLLQELCSSDSSTGGAAVRLHADVKACIAEFLGQIKSRRMGEDWSSMFVDNGLKDSLHHLPYTTAPLKMDGTTSGVSDAYEFTHRVMVWHVATSYCEGAGGEGSSGSSSNKNRRVAIALSRYCASLVVSQPDLLVGPPKETERAHNRSGQGVRPLGYHSGHSRN